MAEYDETLIAIMTISNEDFNIFSLIFSAKNDIYSGGYQ